MGERLIQEAVEHFRAAHVPEYRFPERAASALAVLAQRAEYLARATETPDILQGMNSAEAQAVLDGAEEGWLAPQHGQYTAAGLWDSLPRPPAWPIPHKRQLKLRSRPVFL